MIWEFIFKRYFYLSFLTSITKLDLTKSFKSDNLAAEKFFISHPNQNHRQ